MSNLSEAINYLIDAEEAVDNHAGTDEDHAIELFQIRDRIRSCRGELEELAEEG